MNGTKFQLFRYERESYLNIFSVTKVDKRQINFAGIKIFVAKGLNQFCQLILVCYQNMYSKVGCVISMVVICILPHVDFRLNDRREDAPYFKIMPTICSISKYYIELLCWRQVDFVDFMLVKIFGRQKSDIGDIF